MMFPRLFVRRGLLLAAFSMLCLAAPAAAQRQMEFLNRGVVAIKESERKVWVSWRSLGTDPEGTAFNLYRQAPGGAIRLNREPIAGATHFIDKEADPQADNAYFVRPVLDGREFGPSESFTVPAGAPVRSYLSIPLQVPPGGSTPDGAAYTYRPNDASVGDLTGDGQYEIVLKWDPTNAKDNSQRGYTGNVYLDAYRLDGTLLWRVDLGRNIRAGAHYTQFLVYDFDGDGRAEVVCKTADGTVDARGKVIGDAKADHRNEAGYILKGPEFLTVFDGLTGAELATTQYLPQRHPTAGDNPSGDEMRQGWGDNYGNRIDRFLAGVAYLDGERPSIVMARGYYTRTVVAAWNWRDGKISHQWTFDSASSRDLRDYSGQGNHQLAVADVTGDGRDDIIYGSMTIKSDGTGLYTTRLHHGDALHVGDLDPSRPGLEVFMPHESPGNNGGIGASFRDARTGEVLWSTPAEKDVGRGVSFDVDPRHLGHESWATNSNAIYNAKGVKLADARPGSVNFAVWWDGDLLRELLDRNHVSKWNWEKNTTERLVTFDGATSINGTKANPALSADIIGDWREEVILPSDDGRELRVYVTTIPTEHRIYTLMHDPVYRLGVAWQNIAYNQPPHTGFFLGDGMRPAPRPNIVTPRYTTPAE
jgi:rhamnogalacturonan endolyase